MELLDQSIVAQTLYTSVGDLEISAGERFQVRHGSTGDVTTELDELVPAGKSWRVQINILITETDA